MTNERKRSRWPVAVLVMTMLAMVYALSYAPALKWYDESDPLYAPFDASLLLYQPVEWLIDDTPLRKPLLLWADLWNVRPQTEHASTLRLHPELIIPQPGEIPAL